MNKHMKKIIVVIATVLMVLGIGVNAAQPAIPQTKEVKTGVKTEVKNETKEVRHKEQRSTETANKETEVDSEEKKAQEKTVTKETEKAKEETVAEKTESAKTQEVKTEKAEPKKAEPAKPKLTNEEVANKVLKGEYGNGDARKAAIEKEGYNYNEVQKIVQSKIPKKVVQPKASNTQQASSNKAPASQKTAQARTDGFNFKGHHFSLANFSGTGQVPKETNNVYRWTYAPTHYLIEIISPAGRVIRQVGVGDTVVVDGVSYVVTNRESGIHNDSNAFSALSKHPAHITFQTCDNTKGPNGLSDLTIWWAVKK